MNFWAILGMVEGLLILGLITLQLVAQGIFNFLALLGFVGVLICAMMEQYDANVKKLQKRPKLKVKRVWEESLN